MMSSRGIEALDQPHADEGVELLADSDEAPGKSGSFFARLREQLSPSEPQEQLSVERVGFDLSDQAIDRPNKIFRDQFEGEYIEPDTERADVEPFADPSAFIDTINPHFGESKAYEVNCWDCARALESTWRGRPEVAAGRATLAGAEEPVGEWDDRSEAWYRHEMTPSTPADVRETLLRSDDGASAIVTVQFSSLDEGIQNVSGHAFNYVNRGGEVLLVDGQDRTIDEASDHWPPGDWDPSVKLLSMAVIGWDRKGDHLWNTN